MLTHYNLDGESTYCKISINVEKLDSECVVFVHGS